MSNPCIIRFNATGTGRDLHQETVALVRQPAMSHSSKARRPSFCFNYLWALSRNQPVLLTYVCSILTVWYFILHQYSFQNDQIIMNDKLCSLKNEFLCIFHMIYRQDYLLWDSDKCCQENMSEKNFVGTWVALMHFSQRMVWEFKQIIWRSPQ